MSVAFVFPGQGSQLQGMGQKLAQNFSVAREVFNEVDEALGQNLSKIMFEGPQSQLDLTANTQPAVMSVSIAVLRVMESLGLDLSKHVSFVAGHSLGEYSALCAAGVLKLSDTARLLRIRGEAMQEAVPLGQGSMAAIIGCEEKELARICIEVEKSGQICQIANDNGGGQLVISGSVAGIEQAVEQIKDLGLGRAVFLPVSAPFHCSLMESAALKMEQALARVLKASANIPILPNISVTPETDPVALVQLLIEQVTGRVRWRETIEWFASNQVHHIYEIGWGQVLTKLAKRIDKNLYSINVYEAQEIEAAIRALGI